VVSPSPLGYSRKYLLAMLPAILALFLRSLALPVLALVLILSWVRRSPEATASTLLALVLSLVLALPAWATTSEPAALLQAYTEQLPLASLLASLLTALAVDAARRATRYEVGDTGVVIRTGIWRRQEQTILYTSIGRVILEQSLLGRLLNYGTIILITAAEWGAEYYARGVEMRGAVLGAGYARVLKEISRDPGKCLYGVKNPRKVKERIEARLQALQSASLEQLRYLKEIRDALSRTGSEPSPEDN